MSKHLAFLGPPLIFDVLEFDVLQEKVSLHVPLHRKHYKLGIIPSSISYSSLILLSCVVPLFTPLPFPLYFHLPPFLSLALPSYLLPFLCFFPFASLSPSLSFFDFFPLYFPCYLHFPPFTFPPFTFPPLFIFHLLVSLSFPPFPETVLYVF